MKRNGQKTFNVNLKYAGLLGFELTTDGLEGSTQATM